MSGGHDRGAFDRIEFLRCERGFLLTTGHRYEGLAGCLFAFDRIEDVAAWLVEQYGSPAEPEEKQDMPA